MQFLECGICASCKKRPFGGTCHFHLQGRRNNASEEKCLTVANKTDYRTKSFLHALEVSLALITTEQPTPNTSFLPTAYLPPPPKVVILCSPSCSQSVSNRLALSVTRYFFHPEDEGDTFLRNVGSYKTHTAPHPRRHPSYSLP
jgi:hypothetical protein